MLGNRNITITKGNTTLRGIVESGCRQGGVLSPLLWNLVVDELLHPLTVQGCYPIGYADDILVKVRGMHLDALMGVMQQTLQVRATCSTCPAVAYALSAVRALLNLWAMRARITRLFRPVILFHPADTCSKLPL